MKQHQVIKYKDIKNNPWYTGSSNFEKFNSVISFYDNKELNIQNWERCEFNPINIGGQCVCSKKILNSYFIKNKSNSVILEVGSSCVKKSFPIIGQQIDELKKIERNKNKIKCNLCDKNISTPIINRFEYLNREFYHRKCMNKCFSKCVRCLEYIDYNCLCSAITDNDSEELKNLKKEVNSRVDFGKYKGDSFECIFEKDKEYFIWLYNKATYLSECMKQNMKLIIKNYFLFKK